MYRIISEEYQESKPVINASKLCEENELATRLSYRIADLLEQSKCLIQNKVTQEFVDKVEVDTFAEGYSLAGYGGRRFSYDGKLFFEVEDWIS
jgi:hypothetical protein